MRIPSGRFRLLLVSTLIVLFLALSFNAYACLLPVNGVAPVAMENGCETPDEQPVRQFCDAFKIVGANSVVESFPTFDREVFASEDTVTRELLQSCLVPTGRLRSEHPIESSPQDLLLKISVLRI